MWQVVVNGNVVKEYKHKIQAYMYCFMNGYIYSGGHDFDCNWYYFLDDRVEIKAVETT